MKTRMERSKQAAKKMRKMPTASDRLEIFEQRRL